MALRKRQPPPCACCCQELAARLAGYEATVAAIARATVVLRPIAAHHTTEQGLTAWGVRPADAALIAAATRPPASPPPGKER